MSGYLTLAQTDPTPSEETLEELSRLTGTDWLIAGGIVIGAVLVGLLVRALTVGSLRRRFGHLVAGLIGRLVIAVAAALGLVYALNRVGVSMSPILGLLGLVGLALALAFQDALSNFIAGVMLSTRRPFRVGEEVGTADYEGIVEDVTLRSVTMRTFDGVQVVIPNSTVWDGAIENFTRLGSRRTDLQIGVGYDSDLDQVQKILIDSVASVEGVTRPPEAFVEEFAGSSVNFVVRFWHDPQVAEEWAVRDSVARSVKRDLDTSGIEIPFPQVVVHRAGSVSE